MFTIFLNRMKTNFLTFIASYYILNRAYSHGSNGIFIYHLRVCEQESNSRISIWHIRLILKVAVYEYHIFIIIIIVFIIIDIIIINIIFITIIAMIIMVTIHENRIVWRAASGEQWYNQGPHILVT